MTIPEIMGNGKDMIVLSNTDGFSEFPGDNAGMVFSVTIPEINTNGKKDIILLSNTEESSECSGNNFNNVYIPLVKLELTNSQTYFRN